jgi:hypothetical protein
MQIHFCGAVPGQESCGPDNRTGGSASTALGAASGRKALKNVDLKAGLHILKGEQIWARMRKEILAQRAGSPHFNP